MNFLRRVVMVVGGIILTMLTFTRQAASTTPVTSNHFLYVSSSRLYRAYADGDEATFLMRLDNRSGLFPIWHPDGLSIYLIGLETLDASPDIFRISAYGTSVQRITNDEYRESNLLLSPDGRWIHYESTDPTTNRTDFRRSTTDGKQHESILSDTSEFSRYHSWSNDGAWVFVYLGTGYHQLYRMQPNGSDWQQLTTLPSGKLVLRAQPEGRWRYFHYGDKIYWIPLDGGPEQELDTSGEVSIIHTMIHSPDMRYLALSANYTPQVWVYRVDGPEPHLAQHSYSELLLGRFPEMFWTPDSRWLLINAFWYPSSGDRNVGVYRVDPATDGTALMTPDFVNAAMLGVSPDGRYGAFHGIPANQTRPYRDALYRLELGPGSDGRFAFKQVSDRERIEFITWSPDGQWVYFSAWDSNEERQVYRVHVETNEEQHLRDIDGDMHFIGWIPALPPTQWHVDRLLIAALVLVMAGLIKRLPIPPQINKP